MLANRETNKLIVVRYPSPAGGKFISNCLSLHAKVLPQNTAICLQKMAVNTPASWSYKAIETLFRDTLIKGTHEEWGPAYTNLAYSLGEKKDGKFDEDRELPQDDIWITLTNQDQYYFFMTAQPNSRSHFKNYVNKTNLILTGYEWIMKNRNSRVLYMPENDLLPNKIYFDMSSILSETSFASEIEKTFLQLNLAFSDWYYVERLRQWFLVTHKIGFETYGEDDA